ncbi:amino acid ABC transporter substrate-binding protein [Rhizobium vallis]|uniref:Amino acid ABC transporter substrate-binding protein n=1 Tax=Rhizobium vallis TaxID=634290 RepID=A0A432PC66_9HYPH|nr:ABC transporter substrate-binding protein [Rhizobium vallis]RUM20468.1 amino acid ABC transporter substrate-binding protein [Rhizobium vallis]
MKHKQILVAMMIAVLGAGHALADGSAPSYGKCAPMGSAGSLNLATDQPDTLIVATVLPNPGWYNGMSPASTQDGFEYCMAAEIAHRAGLKNLKLLNLAWDQYISGTARGYDVAIATTTITEKRKQIFNFSQPYFNSNLGVAVKAGTDVTASNIRSKHIGVIQGNMGSDWVINTLKPSRQPALYQTQPDLVNALLAGQVDAIISDTTLVLSATAGTKGAAEVIGQYDVEQGYGAVTPKNSKNSAAIDNVIGDMMKDGTIAALSASYLAPLFGKDPNSVPVWQLP